MNDGVRKFTNAILEGIESGLFDAETIAEACLLYMSESDVQDMAETYELFQDESAIE